MIRQTKSKVFVLENSSKGFDRGLMGSCAAASDGNPD
jgi:hypothetical protein